MGARDVVSESLNVSGTPGRIFVFRVPSGREVEKMLKIFGFFGLMAALAGTTLVFGAESDPPARGYRDRPVASRGMASATDGMPAARQHRYDPRQASRATAPGVSKSKEGVGSTFRIIMPINRKKKDGKHNKGNRLDIFGF